MNRLILFSDCDGFRVRFQATVLLCLSMISGIAQAQDTTEANANGNNATASRNVAADRVWLQPRLSTSNDVSDSWFAPGIQTIVGKVNRYDAQVLEIERIDSTDLTQISPDRVIWIQSAGFKQLEQPMVDLYAAGDYATSLTKLRAILEQRPAVWRQQWITMLAANAALRSGRSEIAINLVSQLDRRPLPPVVIAWLPIAWKRGVSASGVVEQAAPRLTDSSEAVRLVAASWLISSAKRNDAITVLKQLRQSERREIALLAEALLWRTASPPDVKRSAEQWEKRLSAMPLVLQPGPTQTLADQFQAVGLSADAERLRWSMELTPIHKLFYSSSETTSR
ncbi:MAG: hypothetical protein AAGG48_00290 [Planctomycetota bacterium]